MKMPCFWSKQLFWIGFFFTGFVFTAVIYRLHAVKEKILRTPKGVQRVFVMTFYLLPPLVLPLISQPRLPWPVSAGIGAGLTLLITMTAIRVMARGELGTFPVLRQKSNLVTTGIYSRLRHPMYLSNILLAAGWALLFRGIHALLCVPIWTFCYVVLTFFEEKGLVEEYGEKYREYRKKVRYRLVPHLF
jgi:protein-S-isoprenylcysteine O-methyltransferase Ste14